MTTVDVGPEHGTLTLSTGVEGKMAKAGHALTIAVRDWRATVELDGDVATSVTLRAVLASLEVVSGEGGLKPLSDKDKRTIRDNALETLKTPEVVVTSRSVDGHHVEADLTVAGATRPVSFDLVVDGRHVTATVPVVQSDFGVKPYSTMMGQLKVRDRVDVRLEVTVP